MSYLWSLLDRLYARWENWWLPPEDDATGAGIDDDEVRR